MEEVEAAKAITVPTSGSDISTTGPASLTEQPLDFSKWGHEEKAGVTHWTSMLLLLYSKGEEVGRLIFGTMPFRAGPVELGRLVLDYVPKGGTPTRNDFPRKKSLQWAPNGFYVQFVERKNRVLNASVSGQGKEIDYKFAVNGFSAEAKVENPHPQNRAYKFETDAESPRLVADVLPFVRGRGRVTTNDGATDVSAVGYVENVEVYGNPRGLNWNFGVMYGNPEAGGTAGLYYAQVAQRVERTFNGRTETGLKTRRAAMVTDGQARKVAQWGDFSITKERTYPVMHGRHVVEAPIDWTLASAGKPDQALDFHTKMTAQSAKGYWPPKIYGLAGLGIAETYAEGECSYRDTATRRLSKFSGSGFGEFCWNDSRFRIAGAGAVLKAVLLP